MTSPEQNHAVIMVKAVLDGEAPPAGFLESRFRELLPPAPPGPTVSQAEMHAWLEALPESLVSLVVPVAALAAQAIADLASELSRTPEAVLADLAERAI